MPYGANRETTAIGHCAVPLLKPPSAWRNAPRTWHAQWHVRTDSPSQCARADWIRAYVKIGLRELRLDRPPGWGEGQLLSPKGIRTYVYVRAYARTCMARGHHISLFLRAGNARIRTYNSRAYARACARSERGKATGYVRTCTSVRTRVRAWRESTISLSFSGLGAHAYVRTYVRTYVLTCARASFSAKRQQSNASKNSCQCCSGAPQRRRDRSPQRRSP